MTAPERLDLDAVEARFMSLPSNSLERIYGLSLLNELNAERAAHERLEAFRKEVDRIVNKKFNTFSDIGAALEAVRKALAASEEKP